MRDGPLEAQDRKADRAARRALAIVGLAALVVLPVAWPFVAAKMADVALEDCIVEARREAATQPGRSAHDVRRAVWDCARAHGLGRYFEERDIVVHRSSATVRVMVAYTRPIEVLGIHVYDWEFDHSERSCIVAGGRVSVLGGTRPVEDLDVGDPVMSIDGAGGPAVGRVVAVRRARVAEHLRLHLDGGRHLDVTASHPIAVGNGWIAAGSLRSGHLLGSAGGPPLGVIGVDVVRREVDVFDLQVEPHHTFVVEGIVVHNKIY